MKKDAFVDSPHSHFNLCKRPRIWVFYHVKIASRLFSASNQSRLLPWKRIGRQVNFERLLAGFGAGLDRERFFFGPFCSKRLQQRNPSRLSYRVPTEKTIEGRTCKSGELIEGDVKGPRRMSVRREDGEKEGEPVGRARWMVNS